MSDTTQPTPCTCTTCPGAPCTCGCLNVTTQVATPTATQAACGPQRDCGQGCTCPSS